eukprot:7376220-Prymnesium_polylepis.1
MDVIGGQTCLIQGNGGGILYQTGPRTVTVAVDVTLSENFATSSTAIYMEGGYLDIIRGRIERNVACSWAGALRAAGGVTTMHQTIMIGNFAEQSGGACVVVTSKITTVELIDTKLSQCVARGSGAVGPAIMMPGGYGGSLKLRNVSIDGSDSPSDSGISFGTGAPDANIDIAMLDVETCDSSKPPIAFGVAATSTMSTLLSRVRGLTTSVAPGCATPVDALKAEALMKP